MHVLTASMTRKQTETEKRLKELERWRRQRGSGARSSSSLCEDGGGGGGKSRLPRWLRSPALLATAMLLAASLPADTGAGRVLRAVPFLALLPPSGTA